MKDLGEKIRNGGIDKITPGRLGIRTQGKGSFPRINYQTDSKYKENFDRIFRKKAK
mgnify:CR=1 FL=1|tara:strand:- start:85 stop:252 length:168 start_codon:yes stop_codon:yes gene_type:complete